MVLGYLGVIGLPMMAPKNPFPPEEMSYFQLTVEETLELAEENYAFRTENFVKNVS